jgi:hypothetical protein
MKALARLSLAATAVAALVVPVGIAVPSQAATASPEALACHASMSNSHPADYTTTDVRVRTVAQARVTTVAHYKTVNRVYHRRANGAGRATVPYYISGATPGYRVIIDVHVRRNGRNGHCSTSFLPHS